MVAARRGQTNLDFLVGAGVFLLTAGFVAAFVTGLAGPTASDQPDGVVADRVADRLVATALGGATAATVDESCTAAFFGAGDADECAFDPGASLRTRAGVGRGYALNVTVEPNAGPGALCGDGGTVQPCSEGGTRLGAGPAPPDGESVAVATRVVRLDGDPVLVVVRAW